MTRDGFRYLVETVGVPQTFVESMFQYQIWDGNGCFVHCDTGNYLERFGEAVYPYTIVEG